MLFIQIMYVRLYGIIYVYGDIFLMMMMFGEYYHIKFRMY